MTKSFATLLAQDLAHGLPGTVASVNANLKAYGSSQTVGGTSMATNGSSPIGVTQSWYNPFSWGQDDAPKDPGGLFGGLNPFTSSGLGLNIPTAALGYAAYQIMVKKRRLGITNLALLGYGLWGTGIIGGLTGGNQNLASMAIPTAAFAISPTIGAAAVGGLPMAIAAVAGGLLARGGKGKRSSRRGYRKSYSRSYSRPRYKRRRRY